jgi:hypothetical protein
VRRTGRTGPQLSVSAPDYEPVDPTLFWRSPAQIREFILRRNIKGRGFVIKDLTGELFDPRYFNQWAEFVRFEKESQNGLESTENRRSAGRHGNQHVCVRRPQVSGRDSITL